MRNSPEFRVVIQAEVSKVNYVAIKDCMMQRINKQIVILQRRLPHYRESLFECLRKELANTGVELRLVYGQPTPSEENKCDSGALTWATKVKNKYWKMGGKYLCWQPLPPEALTADLVITAQENSILSNYLLLVRRRMVGRKTAFWGHGANLQSDAPFGIKERFKRWTTGQVDWWFAYTAISADLVKASGFPPEKITDLENSVDTAGLAGYLARLDKAAVDDLRKKFGFENCRIGLFIGSLYSDKRLDFLLQAAGNLYQSDPLFRIVLIGDGPLRGLVEEFCSSRSWAIWAGVKTGHEKAQYLALADVILNPGLVGLGILDAFAAGVPMVTTNCKLHSPEIAYLDESINGVMTENSLDAFVSGVNKVLCDSAYKSRLVSGCLQSSQYYTIENMANNFHDGILRALSVVK